MLNPRALAVFGVTIMVLSGPAPVLQVAAQTKPGCMNRCGDMDIHYPFGTTDGGKDCYYDNGGISPPDQFVVYCDNSSDPPTPYYDKLMDIPIVDISVESHEMRISMSVAQDCYSPSGERIDRNSPWLSLGTFQLSTVKNRFTVVGCDTYAYFIGQQNDEFSIGCMSLCNNIADVTDGSCSGVGCCQASFPRSMRAYNISINSYYNHINVHDFNPCGFAFVTESDSFNFSRKSLQNITEKMMPVVLNWSIGNQTCEMAQKNTTSYMCKENTTCAEADSGEGYYCLCKEGYRGNPYLSGPEGCQDVNECETSNPCVANGICTNLPGSVNCSCPAGQFGDPWKTGCSPNPIENEKKYTARDICLGVGIGLLSILLCASWFILGIKQRRAVEERRKFYRENGGVMLERLLSQHQSYVETLKVFSADDLKKATSNYDESKILGEGGQGTVYKGVMDNKIVAIKKAKMLDRSQVDEFINEVIVLSQINHKNVVKLIGCCLETELPLLVYEFIPNGTLSEHIHGTDQESTLSSWQDRLRVAAEIAGALSYLHSDATIPIVHRDIKSTNILLDENYTAKVSDFGASRLMPSDQTQLSTLVQGTLGYLDPEYFHLGQLTEKSDVYSFGIVLAELLTGLKAISFNKPEKERYLSMLFVLAVKEERCFEIIDKRIMNEGNIERIKEVAMLAHRCLKIRGEDRPAMKEVALELEGLVRATDVHPWIVQDSDTLYETEYLLRDVLIHSDTAPIGNVAYDDTIKSQMVPFDIEDGR